MPETITKESKSKNYSLNFNIPMSKSTGSTSKRLKSPSKETTKFTCSKKAIQDKIDISLTTSSIKRTSK